MALDTTKPAHGADLASQPVRDNFVALEGFVDPEHNPDGTHKYALDKRGDLSTGDQTISKNTPSLRLTGIEANAKDIRLVESEGDFLIQKNTGPEAAPVWITMFSIDGDTFLLGAASINEASLSDGTAIPDTKLATISSPDKVGDSALSANIPRKNTHNEFTERLTIHNNGESLIELLDTTDASYKVYLHKTSTPGVFSISVRDKSTDVQVSNYEFSHTEFYSDKSIRTANQLRSSVATGTAPLTVASTTKVANLNADYVDGHSVVNYSSIEETFTNRYACSVLVYETDAFTHTGAHSTTFTDQTHSQIFDTPWTGEGLTYLNAYTNYTDTYVNYHNNRYYNYSDTPTTCFPAFTLVIMANGTSKFIQDVEVGDLVLGMAGTVEVLSVDRPIIGSRKLLAFSDGSLSWSEEHGFWVRDTDKEEFWGTYNVEKWVSEVASGDIPGLANGATPWELSSGSHEHSHVAGWKRVGVIDTGNEDEMLPLFHLHTNGCHTYTVNGYFVSGGTDDSDFNYKKFSIGE